MSAIDMPFVYPDDPGDAEEVPNAEQLGYVRGADLGVLSDGHSHTLFEGDWADENGISSAWISISEGFIEDVSLYA